MLKNKLTTTLAVMILAALAYVWLSPAGVQKVPDITVNSIDGKSFRLSELQGQPVVLTFWATTCPGCLKEMPHLIDLHNELSAKGLKVIGIAMSYDPPNQVYSLIKARQVPYTIALDIDGKAAQAFGNIRLTPTTFLISPEGRIIQKKIGEMDMDKVHKLIVDMLAA
ncbi:MAG: TlpA family protein disulfide reductase [Gammaproteobacteria bacterium]|nr:TlpA family protein disulfide reductase [Gammaproteobacteria bacterium]